MFGLIKSQKIKTSVKILTGETEKALDALMGSAESADKTLERLGVSRQDALDVVVGDDEVESCREDLRAAMMAKTWRLYGDGVNTDDIDRLWRVVRYHLPALAEIVLTTKLSGYGVARYIYQQEPDGFFTIVQVSDKSGELDKYKPKRDGSLLYNSINGEEVVDTHVVHLLLRNRATSTNPAGEMAAARLYPAVVLRQQGFPYALQFIKRYAQPYLVGKIEANDDTEHVSFVRKLFTFLTGGAISIGREDSIEMLQNNADGQAFKRLEGLANARIQKMLLGKVRTSDLETGSRAAQETEEKNRGERIDSYLAMLSGAAQHMVDALVMVNNVYGKTINAPKGLWFEFNQEVKVDTARAERDKHYLDSGQLRLTADYYKDILGFEENHFELVEPSPHEQPATAARLAVKLADNANAFRLPEAASAEQAMLRPKMDAILSALEQSQDYAEFEARLAGLDLAAGDNVLIQRLVGDGVRAFVDGSQRNAAEPEA